MAKNTVPRGETSVIRHVFIMDSTSTAGAGKTGLAYNTASLTGYYLYPGGTATALTLEDITTLGTYAAPTSAAHVRFKEVSAANMPGWYELHFHNDWFSVASGRKAACVQLKGATGMAPLNLEIDCIGAAIQDALLPVNSTQISGDATAADNAEAFFDGTGYAAAQNAIADAVLLRDASNVEGTASDHSLCYVILATSEADTTTNPGKLTVFRTNGITEFTQKTITSSAAADLLTKVQ